MERKTRLQVLREFNGECMVTLSYSTADKKQYPTDAAIIRQLLIDASSEVINIHEELQDFHPVIAAVIVAFEQNHTYFLLHRKVEAQDEEGIARNPELVGKWEFAGGMMRSREQPEETLRREVSEEIPGILVTPTKIILAKNNSYKDGKQYLVLYYECIVVPDDQEKDWPGCIWVRVDNVRKYDCLPATYEIAQKYL